MSLNAQVVSVVLLSFSVVLDNIHLTGVVQERQQAEEQYEEAISGDTAIMLQQVEAGLYTVNIGNLMANETAIIEFSYTQLHHWTEQLLRWHLPTVLAPRYGNSILEPYQTPEIDLTVEHIYTLSVSIKGLLQTATIESPSHTIILKEGTDSRQIQLKEGRAFLERDLILNFSVETVKVSLPWPHFVLHFLKCRKPLSNPA